MSLEKMKRIEGYKNYLVSSWGNVYRTNSALFINPNFGVELPIDNNVKLNPEETKKGYLRVDLYDENGKRKHFKVHRLVAEAFIPNPDGKPQVNHKDGNKHNNSVTNLEWVTDSENKDHRKELFDV